MKDIVKCSILLTFGLIFGKGSAFMRWQFPKPSPLQFRSIDPGEPLFLTPYIEKGEYDTARKLSLVGNLPLPSKLMIKSYSGFLTVDKAFSSNMFFWFFPAQNQPQNAPVLLWLQGGPGGTSMFGLFNEHGPFKVNEDMSLRTNEHSWNKKYSMLYIDNPVGAGFSFTKDDRGYARNETAVAKNLYEAIAQFFQVFSDFANRDFYITGESYAGKYLPALAHYIHSMPVPRKIKLKGLAIGDGFSDPPTMIPVYSDFMYQIGLLDESQSEYFQKEIDVALNYIAQKEWAKAFQVWDKVLNGDQSSGTSFFTNCTGSTDYYNYLRSKSPAEFQYYSKFLALSDARAAIHVGSLPFQDGDKVEQMLTEDIMQSVKPWLAEAMNYYKVLIYSGQLDIIVALPLTQAMLRTVEWKYKDEYLRADRKVWRVNPGDTEVAGYVRRVHDFYQVAVRGGGHILPYDQPERAFDMIDRFITEKPFA